MKYRVGQTLYQVDVDEDTGTCALSRSIVRTLRGGWVYAVTYLPGVTWVKRSTKAGDYGWADNVAVFRIKIRQGEKSLSLHTTKRRAWSRVLDSYSQDLVDDWGLDQAILDKIRRTARRRKVSAR